MSTRPELDLGHVRVHDVMHQGIIDVEPDTPLADVAELMATRRIHAVAVASEDGREALGKVISALDVVAGITSGSDTTARDIAATELLTISSGERLDRAVQLMAEHEVSHLIVTEGASGRPTGVLSTLDILGAVAG
ncbi:MAG: cyclic nucleotide-binding/CBS domain-containing protein [Candidatus Woesearchaeota archaeon]